MDWRISNKGIIYLKWKDTKSVPFVSNLHRGDDVISVRRRQKDRTSSDIPCLQLAKDYNTHMIYIEKSDMHIATYRVDRKSMKWWHRLFWHLLELVILNSYVIFKNGSTECRVGSLKDFRLAVASSLIDEDREVPKKGRNPITLCQIVSKWQYHLRKGTTKLAIYQRMARRSDVPTVVHARHLIAPDATVPPVTSDCVWPRNPTVFLNFTRSKIGLVVHLWDHPLFVLFLIKMWKKNNGVSLHWVNIKGRN